MTTAARCVALGTTSARTHVLRGVRGPVQDLALEMKLLNREILFLHSVRNIWRLTMVGAWLKACPVHLLLMRPPASYQLCQIFAAGSGHKQKLKRASQRACLMLTRTQTGAHAWIDCVGSVGKAR